MIRKFIYISSIIIFVLIIFVIYSVRKSTEVESRFYNFIYWPRIDEIAGVYIIEDASRNKLKSKEGVYITSDHKLLINSDYTFEFVNIDPFFDLFKNSENAFSCKGNWNLSTYFLLYFEVFFYNKVFLNENTSIYHSFIIKRSEGRVYLIYFYKDFKDDDYIVYERVQ
jgi:hypothetical protein